MKPEHIEIVPELNLKNIIAEVRETAQAFNELADNLEQIENKYAEPQVEKSEISADNVIEEHLQEVEK